MATISIKKPARTEQQMFPLVESWLHSNLTQKEFSLQRQIPAHVLTYWISRYRQQGPPAPTLANQVKASGQEPTSFIRSHVSPSNTTSVNAPPTIPSAVISEATAMAIKTVFYRN